MTSYTVKRGDTLTRIAHAFNVPVDVIAKANGIRNPDVIHVGAVLKIPVEETPVVDGEDLNILDLLENCMDALEALPEYKSLCKALEEMGVNVNG